MNILIFSHSFSPSLGGLETIGEALAHGLALRHHHVTVVTRTPAAEQFDTAPSFQVVRNPGPLQLLRYARKSDVVFHNNICARFLWTNLFIRRPLVVTTHTWLGGRPSATGPRVKLKRVVISRSQSIAVSDAIAADLPGHPIVIHNSVREHLFYKPDPTAPRVHDVIFAGRLVEGKGGATAIEAIARLRDRGEKIGLTIVGDGPEMGNLRDLAKELGVYERVTFLGALPPDLLADQFRKHRIAVFPSHWSEPFGIVALEALACGALPIVTNDGGFPEAVGEAGLIVEPKAPGLLAEAILELMTDDELRARLRTSASAHLDDHSEGTMVDRYEAAIIAATENYS